MTVFCFEVLIYFKKFVNFLHFFPMLQDCRFKFSPSESCGLRPESGVADWPSAAALFSQLAACPSGDAPGEIFSFPPSFREKFCALVDFRGAIKVYECEHTH